MLMWEISFGQPPFLNYENDCNLANNIINDTHNDYNKETPNVGLMATIIVDTQSD
ncbi:hypothetical protein RhiirA4_452332 [Rhizophagus irregularis]|uniref:Uncharacterized protein n=1 Tax=Rhizophagus irregularis TaxID=588596 RepID=A0A2I1FXR5_9GLOM|nr:hypothetical protein RhiirA4_452332 [Rhizophagus irregularis]